MVPGSVLVVKSGEIKPLFENKPTQKYSENSHNLKCFCCNLTFYCMSSWLKHEDFPFFMLSSARRGEPFGFRLFFKVCCFLLIQNKVKSELFYCFSFESTWKQCFRSETLFFENGSRVKKFQNVTVSVWTAKTQLFENDVVAPPLTSPTTRGRPPLLLRVFDLITQTLRVFSFLSWVCHSATRRPGRVSADFGLFSAFSCRRKHF